MNYLKSNLEYLLNKHETNPNDLEQKNPEIKQSTVFRILNGITKDPRRSTLEPIAKWAGVTVNELFDKDLSLLERNQNQHNPGPDNNKIYDSEIHLYEEGDPIPDGYVAIDFYSEIKVSAGGGYLNIEQQSPHKFLFPVNEIRRYDVKPDCAKVIVVDGESMVPDLYPGQRISIDTSAKRIFDGEIYAFLRGDELKIKMLFEWNEQGRGGFKAVSRNTDKVKYPDEYYSPTRIEAENVQIIGQYWWKSEGRKVRR